MIISDCYFKTQDIQLVQFFDWSGLVVDQFQPNLLQGHHKIEYSPLFGGYDLDLNMQGMLVAVFSSSQSGKVE
jgi:hypothetical protein